MQLLGRCSSYKSNVQIKSISLGKYVPFLSKGATGVRGKQ